MWQIGKLGRGQILFHDTVCCLPTIDCLSVYQSLTVLFGRFRLEVNPFKNLHEYNSSVLLCILRKACVSRGAARQDGVILLLYLPPSEVFFVNVWWRAAQSGVPVRRRSRSQTLPPLCRTTINHQLSQTEQSQSHNKMNHSSTTVIL